MENFIGEDIEDLNAIEHYRTIVDLSEEIFHDFKNILATISGLAQLSLLSAESDEMKNYLTSINKATFDFRDILNKYYSYTSGHEFDALEPHLLRTVMSNALDMVVYKLNRSNVSSKKIYLKLNINSNSTVLCNEYELRQSFLNIIMNSLDAMEKDGGILSVDVYDFDNTYINIDIMDTGPGIPDENLQKIFKTRFTTKENGTGLGLKIAKNCIDSLGGSLKLESKVGIGTKIQISLPICKESIHAQTHCL